MNYVNVTRGQTVINMIIRMRTRRAPYSIYTLYSDSAFLILSEIPLKSQTLSWTPTWFSTDVVVIMWRCRGIVVWILDFRLEFDFRRLPGVWQGGRGTVRPHPQKQLRQKARKALWYMFLLSMIMIIIVILFNYSHRALCQYRSRVRRRVQQRRDCGIRRLCHVVHSDRDDVDV